jgi:hypothetical protein
MVPEPRQIIGERQYRRALIIGESIRLIDALASDLVLDACDRRETFIPAPFEFAGPTSRLSGSTASYCRRARIAS